MQAQDLFFFSFHPGPGSVCSFHPGPGSACSFHAGPRSVCTFHPGPGSVCSFHPGPGSVCSFHAGPSSMYTAWRPSCLPYTMASRRVGTSTLHCTLETNILLPTYAPRVVAAVKRLSAQSVHCSVPAIPVNASRHASVFIFVGQPCLCPAAIFCVNYGRLALYASNKA